ncbi:hypothetical protein TRVL_06679 [Trypanosoma vivax]|nr:hypothetical protein TRVL_06679 [Trypanosoma vivax]
MVCAVSVPFLTTRFLSCPFTFFHHEDHFRTYFRHNAFIQRPYEVPGSGGAEFFESKEINTTCPLWGHFHALCIVLQFSARVLHTYLHTCFVSVSIKRKQRL